jgi:hypothetical protein
LLILTDKVKMTNTQKISKQSERKKRANRANLAYLDKLIAEATVDCYNESEEITGIFTMLEENLAVPFTTKLLSRLGAKRPVQTNIPSKSTNHKKCCARSA